ncbi:EAL domain-containing protein [Lyngbya confervoides]|uniref:EAL domain-containing protein n=1 Tax=Lyngbya confervoides BDU141951 TaxID=1574623 RepID=A0ABD4T7Q5_9CYAN|nr:EAL domain-containing protein [Lyngbya confervoides]MCM1984804.1 EAL domain-containing protein [Lyngbya confervoides BDU141951]
MSELFTLGRPANSEREDLPRGAKTSSSMRHLLVLREGDQERVITLDAATYSLGRHPANSIVVEDKLVSRQHAILLRIPKPQSGDCFFRIIDGNLQGRRSQNGIWVNGKRLYSRDLRDRDVIAISNSIHATYHQIQATDTDLNALPSDESPSAAQGRIDSTFLDSAEQEQYSEAVLVRLSSFPEMAPHPIVEMDLHGGITYLNPAADQEFSGIRDQPDHPARVGVRQLMLQNANYCGTREIEVAGRIYEQSIQGIPQSQLIRCYLIDITQRRQMERAVRKSEERYALAARGANDGLWDWDLNQNAVYLSPRWKAMIGYAEDEISTQIQEWLGRIHSEDQSRVQTEIERHLTGQKPYFECEFRLLHKNGDYRYVRSRGMAVFDSQNQPLRMAGSQTDITEYHLAREQLLHDAFYDAMTGLPNRVLLLDRVSQALKKCKRHQQDRCAVLFLDLDRFKVINDSLGHMMGDKLIVEVSKRLLNCLRSEDTVARLGGDEFVILLKDVEGVDGAIAAAQKVQQILAMPFDLAGREVFTSVSIGIALGHRHYERPEDLLRDADAAMYQAKQEGKDSYIVFQSAMHTQAVALLELENDLRRAIERQEFQLYYQPIIDLNTHQIRSFEALVRWFHPERGLVPPSDFIPLAEDTGLIIPMGYGLLREACQQLQQWQQLAPAPLSVCVNIASRQFAHADFVNYLQQILTEIPLPPGSLKLEITEGVIMKRPDLVADKLAQLKDLGVQLSVDDFGTGYSSLSYLQTFPVDTLKVDRSFVMKMGHPDSREIVKTIVTLAHNLGLDVVAEGVETQAQAQLLKAMGCEYAQGYHFARPMEPDAVLSLLGTKDQRSVPHPAL